MYDTFCRETLKYNTFLSRNVEIRHFLSITLKYGTFCRKNLDYALRAKKLANLRSEPTPHFMRFMRFVQYGLLRVRNPLTVWYFDISNWWYFGISTGGMHRLRQISGMTFCLKNSLKCPKIYIF